MNYNKFKILIKSETQTKEFSHKIAKTLVEAKAFKHGCIIYLKGDLGAGKSFFARSLIQYFLPNETVKSPTYTIVETYQTTHGNIQHFDLYRINEAEELEFIGLRDLLVTPFIALVEWPQKGDNVMPTADLVINIEQAEFENLDDANNRILVIESNSKLGNEVSTLK